MSGQDPEAFEKSPSIPASGFGESNGASEVRDTAAPVAPEPMGPIRSSERIEAIDILRGLALFGIIAANIRGFGGPAIAYFNPIVMWSSLPDRIAQAFIDTFIQGKFITIFAFLFGVGFAVQLSRASERGSKFGGFYTRRLLILAAIGLVHGLLIWWGDILLPYALTGFLLFFFRKREDSTVLRWAIGGYLVPLGLVAFVTALPLMTGKPLPPQEPPTAEALAQVVRIYAEGSWVEIQGQRMSEAFTKNYPFLPIMFMNLLGLFLFGVLAWRRRVFQPSAEVLPRYRKVMFWAFAIGVPGNIAATTVRWFDPVQSFPPTPDMLLVMVIQNLSIPALSVGYVCAVILLCQQEVWRSRLSAFGAIGRTALSNYLLQSVLATLLFYRYGFGLYGTMGPALLLIPTVLIYGFEAAVSPWWLARWRFGPVEWLWRSLTYGRLQPMSRGEPAQSLPESA